MIEARNVTMKFDSFTALSQLSTIIPDGCIYGLVGSNGAGKSTFLRLLAGVYRPQKGEILFDGRPVYENPAVKSEILFVPDELYFLPQSNMTRMATLYREIYPHFSDEKYEALIRQFDLSTSEPLNTFSKGMRRQAATILALSASPRYLFFDETFDGLDPIKRKMVKDMISADAKKGHMTAIITSHSLRELEDSCDQLSILHKGGIVFESETALLSTTLFKVQFARATSFTRDLFSDLDIVTYSQTGNVATFIVRGDKEKTVRRLTEFSPLLLETLPLSLEEIFVYELSALGYAFGEVMQA